MTRYPNKGSVAVITFILALFGGCTPEPEPIFYGEDQCIYCKMIISERGYGAELVTQKGKVYKFDTIECLTAYILQQQAEPERIHSMWAVNFNGTDRLLDVTKSIFLHSDRLHSPMGLNLSAFSTREDAEGMRQKYGGQLLSWQEVQELVKEKWIDRN